MNQVRIIGGQYRGRKIFFPDQSDLRPTPSRIRETLFNWLAPKIVDSHCLDLFAGSGVLGFESLSRGAQRVVAVEKSQSAINTIERNSLNLEINKSKFELFHTDAEKWLNDACQKPSVGFDIVFLDPPYEKKWLQHFFNYINHNAILKDGALIYFEDNIPLSHHYLPSNFVILKEKKAGEVYFGLLMAQMKPSLNEPDLV